MASSFTGSCPRPRGYPYAPIRAASSSWTGRAPSDLGFYPKALFRLAREAVRHGYKIRVGRAGVTLTNDQGAITLGWLILRMPRVKTLRFVGPS